MIFDRLANAELYTALHPQFAAAFAFLRRGDLPALADGKYELDGDRLYVLVARTPGRGHGGAKLDSHRKYLDIQYVISGSDEIGLTPAVECRDVELPYDEGRDVALYRDQPSQWLTVPAGSFVVFYPDDGHAPLGTSRDVAKAVVKVRLPA